MSDKIIGLHAGLHAWLQTPPGRLLLAWERGQFDAAVADIFGYHALQLGLPELDALAANRMPHRWLALQHPPADGGAEPQHNAAHARLALLTDFAALPFPAASLDLVLLPHALELGGDPHTTLREVERVLVPDGRAVLCGFNPASLWGLRQRRWRWLRRRAVGEAFLPPAEAMIGYWRLRDWLRLLGFEVEVVHFGGWWPAMRGTAWLRRVPGLAWMGLRWQPLLGAAYFVVATKRVPGVKLLGKPSWRSVPARAASASVPVANRAGHAVQCGGDGAGDNTGS